MTTALRAAGAGPGTKVLTNAFTLAPVPGAIAAVGATPVYVEVTEDLVIDIDDLAAKASEAPVLLLSHMRGHICDMDRLMAVCRAAGVVVIEDCAHTMGATWNGVPSGRHGLFGCYSTQTYKHVNSGEGGFLVSDDATAMARAILLSGSYMLYGRHRAAPPPEVFETLRFETPNISGPHGQPARGDPSAPVATAGRTGRAVERALCGGGRGVGGNAGVAVAAAGHGGAVCGVVDPVHPARLAG